MIANDFGLVAQRVFGLALGYEDLNDHDELRSDPVLGALLGKLDGAAEAPAALTGSRVACRARQRGSRLPWRSASAFSLAFRAPVEATRTP
jgi:hypothetical protein